MASGLPKPKSNLLIGGRPLEVDFREIVNACLYQVRSGGAWRMLPHDFPKWKIVYHYFDTWKKDGTWEKIHDQLRQAVRVKAGKKESPRPVLSMPKACKRQKRGNLWLWLKEVKGLKGSGLKGSGLKGSGVKGVRSVLK